MGNAMLMEKYLPDEIFQYKVIKSEEIPFSEEVIKACRENRCGRYATCWTCPPGVGTQPELEKKIKAFEQAMVFTCKYDLEDSFDFEGMMDGMKATAAILRKITEQLKEAQIPHMALGCEGCGLCEKCTYPDAPCRFPDKALPSVEACGIHVVNLARLIGINYNNGPDTVTYFCIILF